MMVKLIALMRRRAGMSREEFIEYYETRHAPLIMSYAKHLVQAYRRSYLDYDHPRTTVRDATALALLSAGGRPFDVMTELVFKDHAALDEYRAGDKAEAFSIIKKQDEEKLFDRDSMQIIVVSETRETAASEFE